MTTTEKRDEIRRRAVGPLRFQLAHGDRFAQRCLDILEFGSDAEIEPVYDKFFKSTEGKKYDTRGRQRTA